MCCLRCIKGVIVEDGQPEDLSGPEEGSVGDVSEEEEGGDQDEDMYQQCWLPFNPLVGV